MSLFWCFLLLNLCLAKCYNVDTKHPIIYSDLKPNPHRPSYFGYSITLFKQPDNHFGLQIGAPRANSTFDTVSTEPGVVYRCGYKQICNEFKLDYTSSVSKKTYLDDHSQAWIGGAMDYDTETQRTAVCGFRFLLRNLRKYGNEYFPIGMCYVDAGGLTETETLKPLLEKGNLVVKGQNGLPIFNYGTGQAGFSVHIPKSEKPELLLGAPGIYDWRGSSVLYRSNSKTWQHPNFRLIIPENKYSTWHYLQGYSIASGEFLPKKLWYVSGGPHAYDGRGQVLIYEISDSGEMIARKAHEGTQPGEYFGAVLSVGDINNDSVDDLLVGAPLYCEDWEEGRVEILFGSRNKKQMFVDTVSLVGEASGGRFGSSIFVLGDLDKDGYQDFVIGAPYEGQGAIYIFNGNSDIKKLSRSSQRISASAISNKLQGFGISFSTRSADFDQNSHNDLVVGAHLSGNVVILRTVPVVTFISRLYSSTTNLENDDKVFTVRACIAYISDDTFAELKIHENIIVDPELKRVRILRNPSNDFHIKTTELSVQNKTTCSSISFYILNKKKKDPISIKLSHKLILGNKTEEPVWIGITDTDSFCTTQCAVLNKQQSETEAYLEIPFALDCGADRKCESDLKVESKLRGARDGNTYVIGSLDSLVLDINVTNSGEPAYVTILNISLPYNIHLKNQSAICEYLDKRLSCEFDDAIRKNDERNLLLELDMSDFLTSNTGENSLELNISISTTSHELNLGDNWKLVTINLIREADVVITGKSQDEVLYLSTTEAKQWVPYITFYHMFEIQKFGSSPIDQVKVRINIPTHYTYHKKSSSIIEILEVNFYHLNQPIICRHENGSEIINQEKPIETDFTEVEHTIKRREAPRVPNSDSLPTNRTMFLNCSVPEIQCTPVLCIVGPFKDSQNVARLHMKLNLTTDLIRTKLIGRKDFVVIATEGLVDILSPPNLKPVLKNRQLSITVPTIFNVEFKENKVPLWIILVAGSIGILLLLILTAALVKLGFFRRKQKEKLNLLKTEEMEKELTQQILT